MHMHVEVGVRRAVDRCCRLPFLRHTPLKELYRLARHVTEVRAERGDAVLVQVRMVWGERPGCCVVS